MCLPSQKVLANLLDGGETRPSLVPARHSAAPPRFRPRRHLQRSGCLDNEVTRHQAGQNGIPKSVAERRCRALDRQCPTRTARSRRRFQRAPPPTTTPAVRRLLSPRPNPSCACQTDSRWAAPVGVTPSELCRRGPTSTWRTASSLRHCGVSHRIICQLRLSSSESGMSG